MKKKLYIIIGKSNSHKSSVTRCLSGCTVSRGNWDIQLLNGYKEKFHVFISSPQERNNIGIDVNQFVEELFATNEPNILLTLQSMSSTEQPNGEVYLQAIINNQFDIQTIACFDQNANTLNLPVNQYNTRNIPTNQTAAEVRTLWGII